MLIVMTPIFNSESATRHQAGQTGNQVLDHTRTANPSAYARPQV